MEELFLIEKCFGKNGKVYEAKRRAKKVICFDCGIEWIIRISRRAPKYCRSCSYKGKRNPCYGKDAWNKGLKEFDARKFNRNYVNQWRWETKKFIVSHMGNQCAMCKEKNLPLCVWQWHHIDPKQKVKPLSQMLIGKRKELIEESKKCVLLCSNCHKIYHYGNERLE